MKSTMIASVNCDAKIDLRQRSITVKIRDWPVRYFDSGQIDAAQVAKGQFDREAEENHGTDTWTRRYALSRPDGAG
jgi:hypothetical protein